MCREVVGLEKGRRGRDGERLTVYYVGVWWALDSG